MAFLEKWFICPSFARAERSIVTVSYRYTLFAVKIFEAGTFQDIGHWGIIVSLGLFAVQTSGVRLGVVQVIASSWLFENLLLALGQG